MNWEIPKEYFTHSTKDLKSPEALSPMEIKALE